MLYLSRDIPITLFRFFIFNIKYLIEWLIIFIVIYNVGAGLKGLLVKDEFVLPVLYEGNLESTEEKSEIVFAVERIKKFGMFTKKTVKKNDNFNRVTPGDYTGGIRLLGTISHSEEIKSMAILDVNGEHETYYTHDVFDEDTTKIVRILSGQVIIERDGSYYSLNIQ
ncbi:general secretion pathway protein C [Yersinia aldovae]|nr:general secretion pathway protein C [Yersinia aldovae]